MKAKKKVVSLAVVLILLAIAATGTLAYITDSGTAHNVITTGLIDIELKEQMIGEDGESLVDFPQEGIPGVMPGADVSKIVSVVNKSTGDAWIRIKVEQSIVGADGNKLDDSVITINYTNTTENEQEPWWILGDDDYWYYSDAVAPGATTKTLFDSVSFSGEMDNTYQNSKISVIVSAEAVQVANNPIPESGSVVDIPGWPAAVTP